MPAIDNLRAFYPTNADYVAVFVDVSDDLPAGALPYYCVAVIGWAVVNDGADFAIFPVVGGESIDVSDEWIYVCRRRDLIQPAVLQRIGQTCDQARDHRRRLAVTP